MCSPTGTDLGLNSGTKTRGPIHLTVILVVIAVSQELGVKANVLSFKENFLFLKNKSLNQKWQATRRSKAFFQNIAEWFPLWGKLNIDEIKMYWAFYHILNQVICYYEAGNTGLANIVVVKRYCWEIGYFLKNGRGLKYTIFIDCLPFSRHWVKHTIWIISQWKIP